MRGSKAPGGEKNEPLLQQASQAGVAEPQFPTFIFAMHADEEEVGREEATAKRPPGV